jgi:phosphoglycerate dehydrogenase-like enzyme
MQAGPAGPAGGGAVAGVDRLWHHAAMAPLRVLEFVRWEDGVWNLPRVHIDRLAGEFPDVRFDSPADRAENDRLLPEADIVLGWGVRRSNFASARRLRWIQLTAAGVGSLLFPELVASPVIVTNARGLHAVSMAEHTLGVMLMLARKLHLARDEQNRRVWAQNRQWLEPPGFDQLSGATLGLVGMGAVGSALAARARMLGMRVHAVRRHPSADPAPADEQWGSDRLPELLRTSDWLVLAVPLTSETRGRIGRQELALMPRRARIVNLGRGALIDEPALVEALARGDLAGAALDVFQEEPLPESSSLWTMPQVIVTPHVSGFGPRFWERTCEMFARNLHRWRNGQPLENVVDKHAGY